MNVMCSGDKNRSNKAEGGSFGATGPARRLAGEVGIMDLRQHHPLSPGGLSDFAAHSKAPS